MPDRGDERGRGGTRTLVTGILAGTQWHPATNPQEATQTARDARDLAVRLRPVLSKLAQAPRGGRRRDLEWLPAVEQLAVDAQYFASWWLPRLEGKSAQSWPSWSADGYADWVKRLDAQRLRTLEMVEGTAPVTRIASVTQLRRGKNAAAADTESETRSEAPPAPVPEAGPVVPPPSPGRHARDGSNPPGGAKDERSARITPLRGPGAALMDAALMDMAGAGASAPPETPGVRVEQPERNLSADQTHIARVTPTPAPPPPPSPPSADAERFTEPTVPPRPEPKPTAADLRGGAAAVDDETPLVPRTPPNQGPDQRRGPLDPDTTRIQRARADSAPHGFDAIAAGASADAVGHADLQADSHGAAGADAGPGAVLPRVPHTPPNQGPADADSNVGADILQIPRTPPNNGPVGADLPRVPPAPVVSLVGDDDAPRVPRTPPNPGPRPPRPVAAASGPAAIDDGYAATGVGKDAATDADSTHVSLAPAGPRALVPRREETARPLFRPEKPASPSASAAAPVAAALAGAAIGSGGPGGPGRSGGTGTATRFGGSGSGEPSDPSSRDEFENFQPGSDLPPPVFPMTDSVEPIDRGRIVRYALAAVVLAAGCVLVFVAATQKSPNTKTAAPPAPASSSSTAGSPVSQNPGAVTAPTATDTPGASSPSANPAAPPSKPSSPPSSAPSSSAALHTPAAAPPPPPPTSHEQQPGGGVRSLDVTSLAPDQTGSFTYVAHVHVTTSGTGSVTVMVTFAGTSSSSSPGSTGAQSQSFALSGKTSYDFDAQIDVHAMCPSSPYIDAVASASGADSAVAYASSPC